MVQPNADELRMPLLDHIRELRKRLLVCVWTMLACFVVSFVFANDAFAFLAAPMNEALKATGAGTLAVTEAMEGFIVQMKVAGLCALFLASPVLSWQTWGFVAPGLYAHERRRVVPLVVSSTLLFVAGAAFAYQVVFRYGFPFLLQANGPEIKAVLSINSYLGMVTTLLLAFGLSFQLPIIIYFLVRIGLVDHVDLIRGFRYSVVAIFVAAAILTPSPDMLSQCLMAGPLLLLYLVGIVIAWVFSTKKRLPAG